MSITALDSTALIYAMNRVSRRTEDRVACEAVFDYVGWLQRNERHTILIPALVLAEFLAFYPDEMKRVQAAKILGCGFLIAPFDVEAALRTGDMYNRLFANMRSRRKQLEQPISKQCLKTDFAIIATAMAHNAVQIIAVDSGIVVNARSMGLKVLEPKDCVIPQSKPRVTAPSLLDGIDDSDQLT